MSMRWGVSFQFLVSFMFRFFSFLAVFLLSLCFFTQVVPSAFAGTPTLSFQTYEDFNADGNMDGIRLIFDQVIVTCNVSVSDFGYTPGNFTESALAGGSVSCTGNDSFVDILLGTPGQFTGHTNLAPTVSYTNSLSSEISIDPGSGGEEVESFVGKSLSDGAPPVISSFGYRDSDGDGMIDGVFLGFSEVPIAASSFLSANDLLLTNVGDFTGLAFGSDMVDHFPVQVSFAFFTFGTESIVVDTRDDSGNLAFSTQNNFSLVDNSGNVNNFLGAQTQAVFLDEASPVFVGMEYQHTSSQIDRVVITWSEDIVTEDVLVSEFLFDSGSIAGASLDGGSGGDVSLLAGKLVVSLGQVGDVNITSHSLAPRLSYTYSGGGNIFDAAGRQANSFGSTDIADGVPPQKLLTSSVLDIDGDSKPDRIEVFMSEELITTVDASAEFSLSGGGLLDIVEGVVECNSGSAPSNACHYNFTTSTVMTNVEDSLELNYTGTAIQDSLGNILASTTWGNGSTVLNDSIAPVVNSWSLNLSSQEVEFVFSEVVDVSSVDSSQVTFQNMENSPTASYSLSGGHTSLVNGNTLLLYLFSNDRSNLCSLASLTTAVNDSYFIGMAGFASDLSGNSMGMLSAPLIATSVNASCGGGNNRGRLITTPSEIQNSISVQASDPEPVSVITVDPNPTSVQELTDLAVSPPVFVSGDRPQVRGIQIKKENALDVIESRRNQLLERVAKRERESQFALYDQMQRLRVRRVMFLEKKIRQLLNLSGHDDVVKRLNRILERLK
jgi:hypothetical protein